MITRKKIINRLQFIGLKILIGGTCGFSVTRYTIEMILIAQVIEFVKNINRLPSYLDEVRTFPFIIDKAICLIFIIFILCIFKIIVIKKRCKNLIVLRKFKRDKENDDIPKYYEITTRYYWCKIPKATLREKFIKDFKIIKAQNYKVLRIASHDAVILNFVNGYGIKRKEIYDVVEKLKKNPLSKPIVLEGSIKTGENEEKYSIRVRYHRKMMNLMGTINYNIFTSDQNIAETLEHIDYYEVIVMNQSL